MQMCGTKFCHFCKFWNQACTQTKFELGGGGGSYYREVDLDLLGGSGGMLPQLKFKILLL